MPLMNELGIAGTVRVSLAAYNTDAEIDALGKALIECIGMLIEPAIRSEASSTVSTQSQTIIAPIAQSIKQAKSWDQTYRELMLAGKGLARLQDQFKTEKTAVHGCESQVWLRCLIKDGGLVIEGDSPSKIVRGLLAVVFEALAGKTTDQVLAFNLVEYLEALNLGKHLSQSRSNGLAGVVDKIIAYCQLQSLGKES
jgi:cysteine desulfurase/selenocysteine lyase